MSIDDAMDIIISCESSGRVWDAFIARGHNAISCDLEDSESPGPHIKGDIREVDLSKFQLMIAHPPCTHLAISGARWFSSKDPQLQLDALAFVQYHLDAPVEKIALENPISVISSKIRKPDQIIHPWMFGYPASKATCLWLKNLPKLKQTHFEQWFWSEVHWEGPSKNRAKNRSRTIPEIAIAMAEQWG